jgi:hypothetical protein
MDDILEHGFNSSTRLEFWTSQLRKAAQLLMVPEHKMQDVLRNALGAIYSRLVDRGGLARYHLGIGTYAIRKVAPQLRSLLDQRIAASANLIKLNRAEAIEKTMRRFMGWASSIPAGGSDQSSRETRKEVRKSIASLPFVERRVLIDQGHKLTAAINQTVAEGNGAIAVRWRSHWRQSNYDYRKDHKERDNNIYLLKSSWAKDQGLVKPGDAGYYENITAVGEEVYCRCWAVYIYHLRDLPADMLTKKGAEMLQRARDAQKAG